MKNTALCRVHCMTYYEIVMDCHNLFDIKSLQQRFCIPLKRGSFAFAVSRVRIFESNKNE